MGSEKDFRRKVSRGRGFRKKDEQRRPENLNTVFPCLSRTNVVACSMFDRNVVVLLGYGGIRRFFECNFRL